MEPLKSIICREIAYAAAKIALASLVLAAMAFVGTAIALFIPAIEWAMYSMLYLCLFIAGICGCTIAIAVLSDLRVASTPGNRWFVGSLMLALFLVSLVTATFAWQTAEFQLFLRSIEDVL